MLIRQVNFRFSFRFVLIFVCFSFRFSFQICFCSVTRFRIELLCRRRYHCQTRFSFIVLFRFFVFRFAIAFEEQFSHFFVRKKSFSFRFRLDFRFVSCFVSILLECLISSFSVPASSFDRLNEIFLFFFSRFQLTFCFVSFKIQKIAQQSRVLETTSLSFRLGFRKSLSNLVL